MKYSAKQIIVLFNKSKSGKSYINVSDNLMTIIPATVYEMCKAGEIEEVETEAGADMMDETDPAKVAFKTEKVKTFTESALARLEKGKRFVEAAAGFDPEAFAKALATANTITF